MRKMIDKMRANIAALDFKDKSTWLATWGGTGLLLPAPGTWGTLAALPFAYGLEEFGGAKMLIFATIIMAVAGMRATLMVEKRLNSHDNSLIVVDEVAGMWLTLGIASTQLELAAVHYGIGFIAFRFFDILKPFPVGWLDKNTPGALGVMLDDLAAGIYAGIVILALHHANLIG